MRIATSSVRSIWSRLPEVLRWLGDRKPDVVALQKISVSEAEFPAREFNAIGYRSAAYGPTCREDFGVAVLSRRESPEPRVLFRGLPCSEASGARLLTVDVGRLRFSSIYAPYGNPKKYGPERAIERRVAWLRCLREHLRDADYVRRHSVLCGDFNVKPDAPLGPKGDYTEREQRELAQLRELGFVDLYRRAHPDGKGFTFGFRENPGEGTSRLHLVLASESLAGHLAKAWVDREYRTEAAPVIVELDDLAI